jgi:hypothetical protein
MRSRTALLVRRLLAGGVALVALAALLPVSPAQAEATSFTSRRTVERHGNCATGNGQWDLKAKPLAGGRLYVEFEVDQIPRGTHWQLFVSQNGRRIAAVTRTARTSRGVQVSRVTHNRAGRERIRAAAGNPRSGGRCFGHLRF